MRNSGLWRIWTTATCCAAMCAVQQTPQRSTGSLTWEWAAETDAADTQSIAMIAKITTNQRIGRESERSISLEDITASVHL